MRKQQEAVERDAPCPDCAAANALVAEMITHDRGRPVTFECGWCMSKLTADFWMPHGEKSAHIDGSIPPT